MDFLLNLALLKQRLGKIKTSKWLFSIFEGKHYNIEGNIVNINCVILAIEFKYGIENWVWLIFNSDIWCGPVDYFSHKMHICAKSPCETYFKFVQNQLSRSHVNCFCQKILSARQSNLVVALSQCAPPPHTHTPT